MHHQKSHYHKQQQPFADTIRSHWWTLKTKRQRRLYDYHEILPIMMMIEVMLVECGIVIKVWDWQIQVLKHPPAKVLCITNWHQIEALCEWNKENLHTKVRGIRGFHGILDLCLIPWYCPNRTVGFVPMKITFYHIIYDIILFFWTGDWLLELSQTIDSH